MNDIGSRGENRVKSFHLSKGHEAAFARAAGIMNKAVNDLNRAMRGVSVRQTWWGNLQGKAHERD